MSISHDVLLKVDLDDLMRLKSPSNSVIRIISFHNLIVVLKVLCDDIFLRVYLSHNLIFLLFLFFLIFFWVQCSLLLQFYEFLDNILRILFQFYLGKVVILVYESLFVEFPEGLFNFIFPFEIINFMKPIF